MEDKNFKDKIFVVIHKSAKSVKVFTLEMIRLCGTLEWGYVYTQQVTRITITTQWSRNSFEVGGGGGAKAN